MTNEKKQNFLAPAFPPQLFQDNFDRFFSVIPGMTKLEYTASCLLPILLEISQKTPLFYGEIEVTPIQASVLYAKDFYDEIDNVCNPSQIV